MSVIPLNPGAPCGELHPNPTCVEVLEHMLERARAGEVVGAAVIALGHQGLSQYAIGGTIGGYGMFGALEMVRCDLLEVLRDE